MKIIKNVSVHQIQANSNCRFNIYAYFSKYVRLFSVQDTHKSSQMKEVICMTEIRNLGGKLVCRIEPKTLTVEIVGRGHKTIIVFVPEDEPRVIRHAL